MEKEVIIFLEKHKTEYILHTPPAVFTTADVEKYCDNLPGLSCKNLFLKQEKSENYMLVILPAHKRMQLKEFGKIISLRRITFAKEDELYDLLKLSAGAVSPFGLLNDKNTVVKLYIDSEVWNADIVRFHPNVNTETIELRKEVFHDLILNMKNEYQIVHL